MRKLLHDKFEDVRIRATAAHVLGHIGTDEAFNLLCDIFADAECDPEVRATAGCAIGDMKRTDAREFLSRASRCDDEFKSDEAEKVLALTNGNSVADAGRVHLLGELSESSVRALLSQTIATDELANARQILGDELYEALESLFEG